MAMGLRVPVVALFILSPFVGPMARAADTTGSVTFFVPPVGNDGWSGRVAQADSARTDGPFATLQAVCRAAREVGTGHKRSSVVQSGEYFLSEPVALTSRDSGLQIVGAPGLGVRLYGGRKVRGWQKDGERFYAAELPGVKEGAWDFRTLIVNGRYCPRARLPKQGCFEHLSVFDVPWMTTTFSSRFPAPRIAFSRRTSSTPKAGSRSTTTKGSRPPPTISSSAGRAK